MGEFGHQQTTEANAHYRAFGFAEDLNQLLLVLDPGTGLAVDGGCRSRKHEQTVELHGAAGNELANKRAKVVEADVAFLELILDQTQELGIRMLQDGVVFHRYVLRVARRLPL